MTPRPAIRRSSNSLRARPSDRTGPAVFSTHQNLHNDMKKIAVALMLSAACALPALAQTSVAPQAVAATPAVDPAAAAAARELLVAMDYRSVMMESFKQMTASLPAAIKAGAEGAVRADPKLNDEQRAKKLAELDESVPKIAAAITRMYSDPALVDEMLDAMIPVYAQHYSVAELRQLGAFYKTPVGAKTLRLMPQLMNEGMQAGQRIMMPRMQKLMQDLQAN